MQIVWRDTIHWIQDGTVFVLRWSICLVLVSALLYLFILSSLLFILVLFGVFIFYWGKVQNSIKNTLNLIQNTKHYNYTREAKFLVFWHETWKQYCKRGSKTKRSGLHTGFPLQECLSWTITLTFSFELLNFVYTVTFLHSAS